MLNAFYLVLEQMLEHDIYNFLLQKKVPIFTVFIFLVKCELVVAGPCGLRCIWDSRSVSICSIVLHVSHTLVLVPI